MEFTKSIWSIRFNLFVCGAATMALEIMGSRLLAPVFGDSVFVWGSIIGVVMTSLALGYYLGGNMADRQPSFRNFSLIILAAGIFTVLIPISSPTVLELVIHSGLRYRYGPLLATALLLAAPATGLLMIGAHAIGFLSEMRLRLVPFLGRLYSIS